MLKSADIEAQVTTQAMAPVVTARLAPLAFAQERLWFLDQLEHGLTAYNVPLVLRLVGPLDGAALERSLNGLVRRHAPLRTSFRVVDGVPQQVVASAMRVHLPMRDVPATSAVEQEAAVARIAVEETQRPFDLVNGPLMRALLLRLAVDVHVLVVTMHHIVSEGGWSMNVFLHELGVFYDADTRGAPPPLPPLPMQYADHARWEREHFEGETLLRELAYWTAQLADTPTVLDLPTDRPRPAAQSYRGAREALRLPATLSEHVRMLSRAQGVTIPMLLLTAWVAVLARYSGQEDLVIGIPIAGRTRREVEGLIGLFANTLAVRIDASGNPTCRELLERVRAVMLGAYAHQALPFARLVEALNPERDRSRPPLVQVLFAPPPALSVPAFGGLTIERMAIDPGTATVDATLLVWDEPDGIRVELEYCTDLFEASRARRMLTHVQRALEDMVQDPEQPLATLPLLSEAERYQLLVSWNATEAAYPHERCLHELIAAQAERTPDAPAVCCGDARLSYAELNQRANQLAYYLKALSVGPNVLVGLAVERSVDTVVGLLEILKAGGAYVPLDPAYPAERLAFVIADSAIRVLVTRSDIRTRLPATEATVVNLDTDWPEIARKRTEDPPSASASHDLTYVIYTSGSTGRPKGVQISHRALVNVLASVRDLVPLPSGLS